MNQMLWDRMNDADFPKNGKDVFRKHYNQVRSLMADRPNDLLEYEVKQGWAPLCKFLNKSIPAQDFPRMNDVGNFHLWMAAIRRKRALQLVTVLIPVLGSLGIACGGILWALQTRT